MDKKPKLKSANSGATHDTTDYFDRSKEERGFFFNLKPSANSMSLRMSMKMLERLKIAANKRDIPYQSLIKVLAR